MKMTYKYSDSLRGYEVFANEINIGILIRPASMNYFWWNNNGIEDLMLDETFESSKAKLEYKLENILQ